VQEPRDRDKNEQFWQEPLNSRVEGLLRGFRLHVRLAKRPQLLFKSTLLRHASLLLLAWSPALIWLLRSQDNRVIIDGLGPGE